MISKLSAEFEKESRRAQEKLAEFLSRAKPDTRQWRLIFEYFAEPRRQLQVIETLAEAGVSFKKPDRASPGAFWYAVLRRHWRELVRLQELGADINEVSYDNGEEPSSTPLDEAATNCHSVVSDAQLEASETIVELMKSLGGKYSEDLT